MTQAEQLAHDQWVATMVMQVIVNVGMPLLVLGLLVFACWVLFSRAQADEKFDFSEIFRDDAGGKVSMTQVLKILGFSVHSFLSVVAMLIYPSEATTVLITFGGTWGPTSVALDFIKRKWPAPADPKEAP